VLGTPVAKDWKLKPHFRSVASLPISGKVLPFNSAMSGNLGFRDRFPLYPGTPAVDKKGPDQRAYLG
jgi:hypothetical protein